MTENLTSSVKRPLSRRLLATSPLQGLDLLNKSSISTKHDHNKRTALSSKHECLYPLNSSSRAIKRKQFDESCILNEKENLAIKMKDKQLLINEKYMELDSLKKFIR